MTDKTRKELESRAKSREESRRQERRKKQRESMPDYASIANEEEAELMNLNPNNEIIYTEIEATYKQSLLRKKT